MIKSLGAKRLPPLVMTHMFTICFICCKYEMAVNVCMFLSKKHTNYYFKLSKTCKCIVDVTWCIIKCWISRNFVKENVEIKETFIEQKRLCRSLTHKTKQVCCPLVRVVCYIFFCLSISWCFSFSFHSFLSTSVTCSCCLVCIGTLTKRSENSGRNILTGYMNLPTQGQV